jgi:hypothetical protein
MLKIGVRCRAVSKGYFANVYIYFYSIIISLAKPTEDARILEFLVSTAIKYRRAVVKSINDNTMAKEVIVLLAPTHY